MQKRKLFIILAVIIIVSLISLSPQCGANTEDKIDVAEDEKGLDEASANSGDKDISGSEEGADEADTEGDDTYLETEAPTITLAVYVGPTYSAAGGICYYRIEASVTGSPTVSFSKDDSGGARGSKKTQINLSDPGDTYILTATATNSEGSATDSITLVWGCEDIPKTLTGTTLVVTKDALAESEGDISRGIEKSVVQNSFNLIVGETVIANYTVTVTPTLNETSITVSGNIHIENPGSVDAIIDYVDDMVEYKIGTGPWIALMT